MTRAKVTWKCIVPSCYRAAPCSAQSDEADHEDAKTEFLQKNSFPRRLSLSDISNPGSPLSVDDLSNSFVASNLQMFTFAELRQVTHNFSAANFLGQGGFGTVHKGFVDDKLRPGRVKPQPVAVKLLDLDGLQGHKEWLTEIIFLGQLRHPHLVKLIGYCWEDEQRLLVYEYMPRGSLENQLFKRYSAALPWSTRMKIAVEAAKGLAFLHEGDKPIIFRDFKASNILLDSDYTAKLSDFGLAKDAPEGDDDSHVSTRVMGTEGYAAPEYILTGHSTTMSDVYSFGVVLLELLTGKRSVHRSRQGRVHSLVEWAKPRLKDLQKLYRIMDPRLEGQFPHKGAQKVAALAHKCLCQHPKLRPSMVNVVKTLEPLPDFDDVLSGPFVYVVPSESKENVGEGGCDYVGKKKEEKHQGCWRHGMRMPRSQLVPYNLDSSLYKKFLELL